MGAVLCGTAQKYNFKREIINVENEIVPTVERYEVVHHTHNANGKPCSYTEYKYRPVLAMQTVVRTQDSRSIREYYTIQPEDFTLIPA